MTLTSSTHKSSCTLQDNFNYCFRPKSSKLSMKSYVLAFCHILPCPKIGQGELKVIIYTALVVLGYQMLTPSSKAIGLLFLEKKLVLEETIFKGFTMYWHDRHLGHMTKLNCINFHSHSPISSHMTFGFKQPNCFLEKQDLILKSE